MIDGTILTPEMAQSLAAIECGYWTGLHDLPGIFVSGTGRVASSRSGHVRELRGLMRGTYRAISVKRGRYLHQVVCEVFHGPRPAGHEVRHLDGNKLNNHPNNLAWGTRSENHRDKRRHGTDASGERNPMAKLTHELVARMRETRQREMVSYRALGQQFGVTTMTTYRAVKGESWRVKL